MWPVSAALSAAVTVSASRISPSRMTSGVWRTTWRKACLVVVGVEADLALVDHRLAVGEHVLDRILDRDDVALVVVVDELHHRGERRALSRAGRAGHEHEAALHRREVFELLPAGGATPSSRGTSSTTCRNTRHRSPCCRKTFARKRPTSSTMYAQSSSPCSSNVFLKRSGMTWSARRLREARRDAWSRRRT